MFADVVGLVLFAIYYFICPAERRPIMDWRSSACSGLIFHCRVFVLAVRESRGYTSSRFGGSAA